jgi:hypothetical protein
MTQMLEPTPATAQSAPDLAAVIQHVLADSAEPLTVPKIRSRLPAPYRSISEQELSATLERQAAANAIYQFPRYRSQQDRYWDRGMPVHISQLLRQALADGPMTWTDLKRKLPAYAGGQAENVLKEQVSQGMLFRHPALTKRSGERFGLQPPDPKEYLQQELSLVFYKLEQMGFHQAPVRAAALQILHDEEWSPMPPQEKTTAPEPPAQPAAAQTPGAPEVP